MQETILVKLRFGLLDGLVQARVQEKVSNRKQIKQNKVFKLFVKT